MKTTGQLALFREEADPTAGAAAVGGAAASAAPARGRLILCRTANDRLLLLFATGDENPPVVELTQADAAWLAGLLVQGQKEETR